MQRVKRHLGNEYTADGNVKVVTYKRNAGLETQDVTKGWIVEPQNQVM